MASGDHGNMPPDGPVAIDSAVAGAPPASAPDSGPRAIVVLGMHRSGTSAAARVLGLMGVHIGEPQDLLPAHPTDNPTGYWERADLNAIHDRLLASAGHAWNRVAGFDPSQIEAGARTQAALQLQQMIDTLDAGGKPWLVKDPRLCLLLSLWRPLLKAAAAYVIVVRDPREIAASMSSGPRGTFTSTYVIALWEKYLLSALAELSGQRVLFVSYANLLAQPEAEAARLLRGLRELGVRGLCAPPSEALTAFLDPRLRRSEPLPHVELSKAQDNLRRWLDAQCKADAAITVRGFPDAGAPDATLAEFEAAFAWHTEHGRAQASSAVDERLGQIEAHLATDAHDRKSRLAEVERTHVQLDAQKTLLDQAHGLLEIERREHQQAKAQLAAQKALFDQGSALIESQRQELERVRGFTDALEARVSATERQRDDFQKAFAKRASETGHAQAQNVALKTLFEERKTLVESQRQDLERARDVASSLAGRLAAAERQRDNLQGALAQRASEAAQTHAQLAAQKALFDESKTLIEFQRRDLERARDFASSLEERLATAERQREDFRDAFARRTIEVEQVQLQLAAAAEQRSDEHAHARALHGTDVQSRDLQLASLAAHANALEGSVRALRNSWSWKATAPLRGVASLFQLRVSSDMEQRLFRWYYSIPGIGGGRKRAFILWLHAHANGLTGNTLSYSLYTRSREASLPQAQSDTGPKRMDADRARTIIEQMAAPPRISIVMPVFNIERRWLMAAVDSVRAQFYPHWELCIADDASTLVETKAALGELRGIDPRVRIKRLKKNIGIPGATNAALELATGGYIGFLDNDDALTRDALLLMAKAITENDADVLYSDEDKLDIDGRHVDAHFKSDFNLDHFLSINYLCHFLVMRRTVLERVGGLRAGYEGAQDYDLLLRATENNERVHHVPHVLYHWRMIPGSTAASSAAKPKSWDAGQRALSESLARRGIEAAAEPGPYPNTFRVRRAIAGEPLVSIVLPFRDMPELLSTCVQSILEKTDYSNFEILGIDNGSIDPATHALMRELPRRDSRIRFISYDAPFNYSAINNFGAQHARGEHLLLLNNDTEVIAPEWLRAMLEHSQRPEVGVVGAKLLYTDTRIQHAGVIVGIGGVAGHAHLLQPCDHPGYFSRAQLLQDLSAVTFACAMTRREVFSQLGGLNERDLTIAFNDVDYCLRAREAGYLVVYTPYATLFHHESKTRGYEDNPEKQARFFKEITYMQSRHKAILERGDPYYNRNLRLDTHDFSLLPGYVDALPR